MGGVGLWAPQALWAVGNPVGSLSLRMVQLVMGSPYLQNSLLVKHLDALSPLSQHPTHNYSLPSPPSSHLVGTSLALITAMPCNPPHSIALHLLSSQLLCIPLSDAPLLLLLLL